MKALKNDSATYVDQIEHAVADCYAKSTEPTNEELMRLYCAIGHCICTQGEKAFVVQLAEILVVRFPTVKGFSPRNLRRMRDFYRTYENSPKLMHKAQALGWTQNAIILECCENNEQRDFYIDLTINMNLSKLSLMREIEAEAFEQALQQHKDIRRHNDEVSEPESNASDNPSVDKAPVVHAARGPFVTACEPPRQGSGVPPRTESNNSDIDEHHCSVKDRGDMPNTKLIEAIRFLRTESMPGAIWDGSAD
jgi:predicted nuclease of restriction endonuclease-like (RecB) superfamily